MELPAKGLLPPAFSRDTHLQRILLQLRSKTSNIEKYIFLSHLKSADVDAFYKLCLANMNVRNRLNDAPCPNDPHRKSLHSSTPQPSEMPACNTPATSGSPKASYAQLYHELDLLLSEKQFISIKDKGNIGTILRNWPAIDEARISVVTDGKSISLR